MTIRLTVAVLTFQRPEQLATTLETIATRIGELSDDYEVTLLVVDNDPDATARQVVAASAHHPTRYALEPTPGIAAARNRALDESRHSRLLAFIDDDEIPEEAWLTSLVATWRETGASAVMGRVVSLFPPDVDPWVTAGHFFDRPSHKTGTRLSAAATGNLLLDLDVVRASGVRFDESLGLGGGEDSIFSITLIRRGGTIVWCQESVTYDPVSSIRANRDWVRHRAFSHGNSYVQVRLRLAAGPLARLGVRASGLVGGPVRIAIGGSRLVWGTVVGSLRHRVRGVRAALRGLGVLTASLGYSHAEYRRMTPSRTSQGTQP